MEKMMRYTLLVAVLFVWNSGVYASHSNHSVTINVVAAPEGVGRVYVSNSATATTSDTQSANHSCNSSSSNDSKTYYFLAEQDDASYLFAGWFDGETKKSDDLSFNETINASSYSGSHTWTAKWVQPEVTAAHNLDLGTVTDPEARPSGNVVFDLNDDISILHFDRTEGAENDRGFELGTNTYATGIFTVPVTYTPQRKHGSYSGTITLNSQYKDAPQTATVTVTENYTPSFSVPVTSYDFTPGDALFTGSTKESTRFVPATPNYAASSTYTQWTATITGANASIFRILGEPDADGGVVVSFEPTEAGDNFSASLDFSCTYTDANGLEISSGTHSISLSGDAQVSTRSCITLGGSESYAHTFASANVGSTTEEDVTMVVENVANIHSEWVSGNGNDMFSCEVGGGFITLTVNGSGVSTGQYSAQLRLFGDNTLAGGTTEKTLTVNATMCLAKPELQALAGYECATLIWPVVEGATGYEVYQDEDEITSTLSITTTDGNNTCKITGLTNGTPYKFRVIAIAEDAQYNGVDTKTCKPGTIVAEAAKYLGIKTGTNGSTDIDLTYAFVEGKAYFDVLYIFGPSTNVTAPTASAGSSAVTPCYIFEKNGDCYEYREMIANMNVGTKPARFTVVANNQKIYLTGDCPYASTGSTTSEDGVLLMRGTSNKTIDVYLDNCNISARTHCSSGHSISSVNGTKGDGKFDTSYSSNVPKGTGGVFLFECSDTQAAGFSPSLHIRGNNYAKSQEGLPYGSNWQWCAPIDVHLANANSTTNLTMDDLWPISETDFEHTNGKLTLAVNRTQSLAINLGNAKGSVTFNGGQYILHAGYVGGSSTTYKVFMAIGYLNTLAYGVGSAVSGGTVIFNDGTFDADATLSYAPYNNKRQIRTPKNTIINGGAFRCDVVACSGDQASQAYPGGKLVDRFGGEVVYTNIKANEADSKGLVTVDLPYDASQYYYEHGGMYGMESITAASNGTVNLYLPGEGDYGWTDYSWLYAVPPMTGGLFGGQVSVGGNTSAHTGEKDRIHNLLYIEVDKPTRKQINEYQPSTDQSITLSIKSTAPDYGGITNEGDYTINKNIQMLIPVVADRWYTFTAPFDVNRVSVLEMVDETSLEATATSSMEDAYADQAYGFVDWVAYLAKNIYSGSYMGYSTTATSRTYSQMFDLYKKNINSEATQITLKAFKNQNDWDANYFLYEPAVGGVASDHWAAGRDNLAVEWIPAQSFTDGNGKTAIMQRGKTYAIQFPYCPGCDAAYKAADPGYVRDYWDYWTGKYILLEGYGPQTIWGKTSLAARELTDFTTPGQAAFRGNASFAETTVTNGNVWFHNDATDMFVPTVPTSDYVAKPGQGFLLVNKPAGAPARSYPFQAPTTGAEVNRTTGIPTIGQSEWRSLNPTGEEATKMLINGEVYILRAGKLYTLTGMPVY